MLRYRLISGPILIVAFLAIIWLDEFIGTQSGHRGVVLFAVSLLAAPFAAMECAKLFEARSVRAVRWLLVAAAWIGLLAMFILQYLDDAGLLMGLVIPTATAVVLGLSLVVLSWGKRTEGVIAAAAGTLLVFAYLGVVFGFYLVVRIEHSAWWIAGIIMTVKMCDTGAYTVGSLIGRHKLIPWLSPGKTWEGLVGGVMFACICGAVLAWLSRYLPTAGDQVPVWMGAIWGVVFGVAGQLGDLSISLAKRDAGVKDSSSLLPGLGGLLDVLDSPIAVAPVAWWLITLCEQAQG